MKTIPFIALTTIYLSVVCSPFAAAQASNSGKWPGVWTVELETAGGPLPFKMSIQRNPDGAILASIHNGPEKIEVDASIAAARLTVDFAHYDSRLVMDLTDSGTAEGHWTKQRGAGNRAQVPCVARLWSKPEHENPDGFLGRWSVQFADSEDPAVAVFNASSEGRVDGTFLTTTGDYRYLSGYVKDNQLRLSCFDGAHAFLFSAKLQQRNKLVGDFWSGNWYHESWTATLDPQASLPDAFRQTSVEGGARLGELAFPNLEGQLLRLDDPSLLGKVTLIEIFGSWCPNCHDEAAYLRELRQQFGARGLQVVGLAFELTGDFERDSKQVSRYVERFQIDYPVLIAGLADKAKATEQFPLLDRIRSYPTTLFVDRTGTVRAVYTGFSGPATGKAHAELRTGFERLIESMLSE